MSASDTNVVSLDSVRPTKQGQARCLSCKHEWQAIAPIDSVELECPSCSLQYGRFIYMVHRTDRFHWNCACGNDLFHITPEGSYCPSCGKWAKPD